MPPTQAEGRGWRVGTNTVLGRKLAHRGEATVRQNGRIWSTGVQSSSNGVKICRWSWFGRNMQTERHLPSLTKEWVSLPKCTDGTSSIRWNSVGRNSTSVTRSGRFNKAQHIGQSARRRGAAPIPPTSSRLGNGYRTLLPESDGRAGVWSILEAGVCAKRQPWGSEGILAPGVESSHSRWPAPYRWKTLSSAQMSILLSFMRCSVKLLFHDDKKPSCYFGTSCVKEAFNMCSYVCSEAK